MNFNWMSRPRAGRAWCLLCAAWLGAGCDADHAQDKTQDIGSGAVAQDLAEAAEIDTPPIAIAANDAKVRAPMDATPSPDGKRIYYTALQRDESGDNVPGVFSTGPQGGAIETLAIGGALQAPVSISVNLKGDTLFIADTAAASDGRGGAILALSSAGGEPSIVAGTEGYVPSGLTVARVEKAEQLYFTGREPGSGKPGVFRVGVGGGAVQAIASGASFGDPGAVAVDEKGVAYVVDGLRGDGSASLHRVRGDKVETLLEGIAVGFPAGVALDKGGATALVSGLHPKTKRDVVYVIDTASGKVSLLSKPFAGFHEAAGLHRAHDSNVFAWADSEAGGGTGTVYTLQL